MMTILLAAAAAIAKPAAPPPPAMPTLDQMLAICPLPPEEAQRRLAALPERVQAATALLCIGYLRGQADLLRALQGEPGKASSI